MTGPATTPSTDPAPAPAAAAQVLPSAAAEPVIIVIFGITGDLAKRYLLPSLYRLLRDNLLHEKTEIIGISRRDVGLDDIFDAVEETVTDTDRTSEPVIMAHLRSRSRIHQLDTDDPAAWHDLKALLNAVEESNGVCMNRLYYLSIPPSAYSQTIARMGEAGLNGGCRHGKAVARLLVEKPFGQDLASAEALIAETAAVFAEEQVFRIDHYLAKETAQNISAFRFENPLFEAIWDHRHVASIDIVASEKLGVKGREAFYEQQGALRDVIQNHLLQLLAVAAMDQPQGFDSDAVHAAKLSLLKSVAPVHGDQVAAQTVRAQYEGYRDEVGNPESQTETYASIRTILDSPRWLGVPVSICTGKAMAEKRTTITFTFKDEAGTRTNALRFRIQPDEGIELGLLAKKPGFERELQSVTMDFSYSKNFDGPHPDAYERVLSDAVRGDRTLFASSQEVLAAWRVVDPIVKAWSGSADGLRTYQRGTPIEELSGGQGQA